jgi:sortase A
MTIIQLGKLLIGAGVAALAWAAATVLWQEPFTALYAGREQRRLVTEYRTVTASYGPVEARPRGVPLEVTLRRAARHYRASLAEGKPLGRLTIPRLRLRRIVVNGASIPDLRKGPGRDLRSFMPGEGELVYIAGHRTTYGAPFRDIDDLRPGDRVYLEVPYARFTYEVVRHLVVTPGDLRPLRSRGREELRLQASHPPFSARQRYVVYARFVTVS